MLNTAVTYIKLLCIDNNEVHSDVEDQDCDGDDQSWTQLSVIWVLLQNVASHNVNVTLHNCY
jgi:hypothetical protein